ncbi:amidohydrolase [Klebsiella quasivariicola]|nr:amidohydrolase [Klebsiella quasivariicola]
MEAIFQFVDEMIEAQRDTYCAIADDHLGPPGDPL